MGMSRAVQWYRVLVLISSSDLQPGTTSGRSTPATRYHALDAAKGVGILLVVFGHAWRGVRDAGLLQDTALFERVDAMIYAWHMPFFFFLSGLLILDVLERVELRRFLVSRVTRLLWPFVLWTWLFFGLKLVAGGAANHPVTLAEFPLIPLPPYEHLWFLWALFLAQIVLAICFVILRPLVGMTVLQLILGLAALSLAAIIPYLVIPSPTFGAAIEHFPYFIAGAAMGTLVMRRAPGWLALVAAVLFGLLLSDPSYGKVGLLVAMTLCLLACTVISWLDPQRDAAPVAIRLLRYLGLYSLPIFLAHTVFSAAFRIGLLSQGVEDLPVHLVGATVVGLAGPIVLARVSQHLGASRLLGF